MQAKELRAKNINELLKELESKKKELEKHMAAVYKGKEKNLLKSRFIRKDIARIATVISEKKFLEKASNA